MIHPNKSLIESAILKGEKYVWIENEYNVSNTTIKRYKLRMGIELKKRKLTKDDVAKIIKLKGAESLRKIGERFGVSKDTIGNVFKKVA